MFDTFSKVKGFRLFICVTCHDFNDLKKKNWTALVTFPWSRVPGDAGRLCAEAAMWPQCCLLLRLGRLCSPAPTTSTVMHFAGCLCVFWVPRFLSEGLRRAVVCAEESQRW